MSGSSVTPRWSQRLERVAGRYAFSPWLILVSAPFLVTGIVATEISASTLSMWWLYALAGIIGHLAMAAVFFLGGFLLNHSPSATRQNPILVLLVYFLSSQLRAVVFALSLDAAELSNETPLAERLLTSGVLITLAFAFSSYSLESYRRFVDTREELVRSLVDATTELEKQQAVSESLRDSLMGQVDSEVEQANQATIRSLDEFEQRLRSGMDVRPELRELLDEADRRWRNISHSTWERANLRLPRATSAEFFQVLLASRPLSLTAIALGGLFMYALALGRSLEQPGSVLWSLVWTAQALGIAFIVNSVGQKVTQHSQQVFLGSVGLFAISGVWLFLIPALSQLGAWGALTIHILSVGTAVAVGYGPALSRNRDLILAALTNQLDQATLARLRTESEMVLLAQKVASRLHANNRGYFLAKVHALQKALDQGDSERALEALVAVREALLTTELSPEKETEDSELVAFLENWRGLVDIRSNLHTVSVPQALHPAINTILIDAVNDAVRHGGADWIDITLDTSDGQAVLTVVNNGKVPEANAGGIGSRTLDRLATAGWSRQSDSLGFTRLSARFHTTRDAGVGK